MYHNQMQRMNSREEGSTLNRDNQSAEVRRPRIDLFETAETLNIRLSLPGVKKENLEVKFNTQGDLEIKGIVITNIPKEVRKVIAQEIYQGPFYRVVHIPRSYDKQGLKFGYDNGILEIFIKKLSKEG